MDRVTASGKNL